MRYALLFILFLQVGCATKYILPGNRFMTPESQGGMFLGQIELQQPQAHQLTIITDNATVDEGVESQVTNRTGFMMASSLLDQLDLFWSHIGGANSLLGAKFQILGGSRSSKATGDKLAISAAFGGNEHEIEGNPSIEFELSGQEFMLLYGYRFNEFALLYSSLSYSKYAFAGELVSSNASINGLKPEFDTKIYGASGGVEVSYGPLFGKLECAYQLLQTTDSKEQGNVVYGYSVGYSW